VMTKEQVRYKRHYSKFFSVLMIFLCFSMVPTLFWAGISQSRYAPVVEPKAESLIHEKVAQYPTSVILSPLPSVPVIQERGKSFDIKVNVSADASNWNAWISTQYHAVPLTINSTLYDDSAKIWSLSVGIPSTAETELYSLTVQAEMGGITENYTQPRAVQVISHFPTKFNFVVMNDVTWASWDSYSSALIVLGKAIEEVNMIHPSFVLFTGDLVNTGGNVMEYQQFYEYLQMFEVPTYVAPGNHEMIGDYWKVNYQRYIGPCYYSFDFGTYHIVTIDSGSGNIDSTQLNWVRDDLASHANSTQIFMQFHYPIWMLASSAQSTLLNLTDQYNVSMIFSGHIHQDSVFTIDSHRFVTTTAIGGNIGPTGYWGYRLVRVDGETIISYNYAGTTDESENNAIPFNKLDATYFPSNNGTSNYVTATIDYALEENLTEVMLKLVVPRLNGMGSYQVKNGIVLQIINGTDKNVYYMETNLTARKTGFVAVSLHQTSETLGTMLNLNLEPDTITLGNLTTITAELADQNNAPVPSQNLSFYICKLTPVMGLNVDGFIMKEEGWNKIGSEITNDQGIASITYKTDTLGTFKIVAAYNGSVFYAGCSSIATSFNVYPIPELKVLWDEGHGQYYTSARYSILISDLLGQKVMVDAVSTELNASVLSGYSILVVTNPVEPLSPDEISAVAQFVQGGGSLILTGDVQYSGYTFGQPDYLSAVLEGLGVVDRVRFWGTNDCGDEIYDDTSKVLNAWQVVVEGEYFNNCNAIAWGIQRVAIESASLNVTDSNIIVATTPPSSYTRDVNNVLRRSGRIPWLAALEVGEGKVIVCGSSKMFSDLDIYGTGQDYITYEYNEYLFFNFIWWMAGKLKAFLVSYEEEIYCVTTYSNSTVAEFNFSRPDMLISFNVTTLDGASGFCVVIVPKALLKAVPYWNWTILLNGANITQYATIFENGDYTFIFFDFTQGSHRVQVIGTWVVPEFPAVMILPLLLIVALVSVIPAKGSREIGLSAKSAGAHGNRT